MTVYERVTATGHGASVAGCRPLAETLACEGRTASQWGVRSLLPRTQRFHVEPCGIRVSLVVFAQTGQRPRRAYHQGRESELGTLLQALASEESIPPRPLEVETDQVEIFTRRRPILIIRAYKCRQPGPV